MNDEIWKVWAEKDAAISSKLTLRIIRDTHIKFLRLTELEELAVEIDKRISKMNHHG